MCGIVGIIKLGGEPVRAETVRTMCARLRHRGPDDQGFWIKGPVGLGHRRLSIVDLSPQGRNPMTDETGSLQLVFNGEIYNFRELRKDLEAKGHVFTSNADTEVVVHLYEEHGTDCVGMLNGMFALALWDPARRRLLLARDRAGVKPLYVLRQGQTLAFASEAKAFLDIPGFRAEPDPVALADHFTFQFSLGNRSFFKGVEYLEAGHIMVIQDQHVSTHRYWDLVFEPEAGRSPRQWADEVRETFAQAVEAQMVSDVPVGTYLSGGMDTGSISAVASDVLTGLHSFTCGFVVPSGADAHEQYFDEREQSRSLAARLGTEHHELVLDSEAMFPVLPAVVYHLDEPRVGISYQVLYTARMIRDSVKVVLSGVGGDELFAGYPWRYAGLDSLNTKEFSDEYYRRWIRFMDDREKTGFFSDSLNGMLGGYSTKDAFNTVLTGAGDCDSLHKALYFDFKTFLNGLLMVDDKLSMAHSVEARVPFLDNSMLDLAARMPSEFKLQGEVGKRIVREAMQGLVPDATLRSRKVGFTPPDASWYRGPSLAAIRDLLLGDRAMDRGWFRRKAVADVIEEHVAGKRNHRFLIWSLMCFEWWNRLFVDREPLPEILYGYNELPKENQQ